MATYTCEKCARIFKQKSGYNYHIKKIDCTTITSIAPILEEMKEMKREIEHTEPVEIDFSKKTKDELKAFCKENSIKGYSEKKNEDIIKLIREKYLKNEIIIPATESAASAIALPLKMIDLFAAEAAEAFTATTTMQSNTMDYTKKTREELIAICKEKSIKGYSGKKKEDIIILLNSSNQIALDTIEHVEDVQPANVINEDDHNKFVYQTMLTCIGNKRKLVLNIRSIIDDIRILLSKEKLNIVDGFAGSSVVSRELTYISENLYTNDMELYSYLMAYCYLVNPSDIQKERVLTHINIMNEIAEKGPYYEGIICKLYAPKDSKSIKEGERCFYTRENALIIDTLRKYISDNVEEDIATYCLVPLLNKASINTNTAGVFKGFYKKDNIGWFGGKGEFALSRITKPIRLDIPIWNCSIYRAFPSNKDINVLVDELPDNIDVMYLDPPYNQHPYGSNYFMLNVIAKNEEPTEISNVSGIPANWNKSNYNSHKTAVESMKKLMTSGISKSMYLLISYNNEGIITDSDWKILFEPYNVKKYEINYDTYKGSRNLKDRSDKVIEIMYLVSKK